MALRPRRPQPVPMYDQPVRVYKFIALSFLLITAILFGAIVFLSSRKAVITINNKTTPAQARSSVILAEKPSAGMIAGNFFVTSTKIIASYTPTGSKSEEGLSKGSVTLFNDSGKAQPLVATTRVLSSDGILFHLDDTVTVPAGGSLEATVYADKPGSAGDIPAAQFTIPGLNDARQKEVYAKSNSSMSGGTVTIGILSSSDMKSAEAKLIESLESKIEALLVSQNSNDAYVYEVNEQTIVSDVEVGEEVSGFNLTANVDVVAIFYDESQMRARANDMLIAQAVDENEIISPSEKPPTVTIQDLNLGQRTAKVEVFTEGSSSINPESNSFAKEAFFGMSNDEVRRYLLTFDHVRGVEVTFTPKWTFSVPHVEDRVRVVIKDLN